MERDTVIPIAPNLCKRYVDDIFTKRKKNKPDDLYNALDNYHPNISLTVKVNPYLIVIVLKQKYIMIENQQH